MCELKIPLKREIKNVETLTVSFIVVTMIIVSVVVFHRGFS